MSRIDRLERAALVLMRAGADGSPPRARTWDQAMAMVGGSLGQIKADATPPMSVGPVVPVAPARGSFRVFTHLEFATGRGGGVARPAGHAGRQTLAATDVFDRMSERARQRAGDGPFVPPLTHGQVAAGRMYRDLVERHSAGGVKCSSLEAQTGGGGSGGFMDAHIHLGRQIDAMRGRIGAGAAMVLRRIRPSQRGSRATITDRALVDAVCLRDMELGQVLRAHGWSTRACMREALRSALAGALDRMQGYDVVRPQDGA